MQSGAATKNRSEGDRHNVSNVVRERISGGIYHAGDKVASVREMSQQLGVTVSIVLEGYRQLESEGVIVAKPQSGFYVQLSATRKLVPTAYTQPPRRPMELKSESIVRSVLRDIRNPNVVQLASASPDSALLPARALSRLLGKVARDMPEECLSYAGVVGYRPLREQIAKRMFAASVAVSPDEILVTAGGSEALNLCLRAVCKPGDIVAVESPTYYATLLACRSLNLRVLEVSTHTADGMSLNALHDLLETYDVSAVVLTPSFGNPLGSLMPDENKSKLVKMLAEKKVALIEDDVYGDLGFGSTRPIAAKAFDREGMVLYCSSFSKTLAPGFRIGWVIGGKYQDQIELLKFATSASTASPQQIAIADFLVFQRYSHHVRRAAKAYQANTIRMADAVRRYFPEGTIVNKPQGGFVLWVQAPDFVDSLTLYERAVNQGIVFMPGPAFSARETGYRNFLRLNASQWNPEVEAAVKTLGRLAN